MYHTSFQFLSGECIYTDLQVLVRCSLPHDDPTTQQITCEMSAGCSIVFHRLTFVRSRSSKDAGASQANLSHMLSLKAICEVTKTTGLVTPNKNTTSQV